MSDRVDLVLSDHNMPGMDGLELAETLCSKEWDSVPILLLSSNPRYVQNDPARAHLSTILQKPMPREELFRVLARLDADLAQKTSTKPAAEAPQPTPGDSRWMVWERGHTRGSRRPHGSGAGASGGRLPPRPTRSVTSVTAV